MRPCETWIFARAHAGLKSAKINLIFHNIAVVRFSHGRTVASKVLKLPYLSKPGFFARAHGGLKKCRNHLIFQDVVFSCFRTEAR